MIMWNPFRLASSLLPYLLLGIFVFPFAAHGFNRSEHDIPPPLPEHRWVGKSVLNYTVLHEHFVEVLVCTTIPVGALGFYFWLVLIVVDLISILKIAFARDKADDMSKQLAIGRHRQTTTRRRRREQGRHGLSQPNGTSQPVSEEPEEPPIKKLSKWETFLYFLKGIAGHAFSIGLGVFTIIQSIATLRDCENARGFDVIKGIIVTILVASFFSLLGNTMSLYAFLQTGWAGGGGAFKVAIFFLAVSVLIKYFAGGAYFLAVTVSEGILKKLWLHPDKTAVGAEVVTMLPYVVVALITLGVSCMGGGLGVALGVVVAALELGLASNAMGNVLLGKIIGDPWGGYILRVYWGQITAVFTGTMPFLEAVGAFFVMMA